MPSDGEVAYIVGTTGKRVHLARVVSVSIRSTRRPICGALGGPWEVVDSMEVTCGHCRKRMAREATDAE